MPEIFGIKHEIFMIKHEIFFINTQFFYILFTFNIMNFKIQKERFNTNNMANEKEKECKPNLKRIRKKK